MWVETKGLGFYIMSINYLIPAEPNTPENFQSFWCTKCDREAVNSNNPDTGKFFIFHGHSYSQKDREYTGNYIGIMIAVCHNCLVIPPSI